MHIYPRNPYGREETPRYRDRLGDLDIKKKPRYKRGERILTLEAWSTTSEEDQRPSERIAEEDPERPVKHPRDAAPRVHLEASPA